MRVELKKLLESLGINRELHPYETQPWLHYDEEKGITCSAEVRMGPGNADLEAEIQFLKDEPDNDEETKGETEDKGEDEETTTSSGPEQIMLMHAEPSATTSQWSPKQLKVKGKNYVNEVPEWEEKGCSFFKACIQAIQMGELPDIDDLVEKELEDGGKGGGRRGRIGRKSPKIKPGALLGIKKPGSM